MPGSKTSYLSKKLLDHVAGATIYVPPATMYVALSLSAFDPEVTGDAFSEISDVGTAYARVAVTNDTTNWPLATLAAPAVKSNGADIIFPTATDDWGLPLAVYLLDAASSGNPLYGCDINSSDDVLSGGTFKILEGTLILTED